MYSTGGTILETTAKRLYEGLFLVDSGLAAAQWDQIQGTIRRFLDRAEAEVVSMKKWDERKLAYDIRGKSRGTYILCYFECDRPGKTVKKFGGFPPRLSRCSRVITGRVTCGN